MKMFSRAMLAAGLALASASAFAGDVGHFFANVGVGRAQYDVGHTDGVAYKLEDKGVTSAVRFGYRWHAAVDFGVEAGYVHLGKAVMKYHGDMSSFHSELNAKGWLLGANAAYHFQAPWYVEVRGGWVRSDNHFTTRYEGSGYSGYVSGSGTGHGLYTGIGAGYDFSRDLSLGVHYDSYHPSSRVEDVDDSDSDVSTLMVQLEYRF